MYIRSRTGRELLNHDFINNFGESHDDILKRCGGQSLDYYLYRSNFHIDVKVKLVEGNTALIFMGNAEIECTEEQVKDLYWYNTYGEYNNPVGDMGFSCLGSSCYYLYLKDSPTGAFYAPASKEDATYVMVATEGEEKLESFTADDNLKINMFATELCKAVAEKNYKVMDAPGAIQEFLFSAFNIPSYSVDDYEDYDYADNAGEYIGATKYRLIAVFPKAFRFTHVI